MTATDKILALDVLTFLAPDTLEDRVGLAMRTAGEHLCGHGLANAWLEWIARHGEDIRKSDMAMLTREALRLNVPAAAFAATTPADSVVSAALDTAAAVAPMTAEPTFESHAIATTIPKTIHIVWIGDPLQRPDNLIATWIAHHAGWTIKVWGNDDLAEGPWNCADQMLQLGQTSLSGLATLMQWEILYREGGVAVAADSLCIRGLDAALLAHERFACHLSESAAPGVLSGSYFGCHAGDMMVARLLNSIIEDGEFAARSVSEAVGDSRITAVWKASDDLPLTILPSHTFLPLHHAAQPHDGLEGVVACELWSTALGLNDKLAGLSIESLRATLKLDDGESPSGDYSAQLDAARSFLSA